MWKGFRSPLWTHTCACFRCWFGKRAGVYTDYIYQGPMILVLVVSLICDLHPLTAALRCVSLKAGQARNVGNINTFLTVGRDKTSSVQMQARGFLKCGTMNSTRVQSRPEWNHTSSPQGRIVRPLLELGVLHCSLKSQQRAENVIKTC